MKENLMSICRFYAISPIHAGSGMSTGAVDLPIQRERHTNWPHIQASGVKGSMRAAFRERNTDKELIELINIIFGLDSVNDKLEEYNKREDWIKIESLPGAITVSDAKLLAFPMRSNIAPFVWVTSPAVLNRFNTDMVLAGLSDRFDIPEGVNGENAIAYFNVKNDKHILLEDIVVEVQTNTEYKLPEIFNDINRLVIVSDSVYKHCVDTATEVQTQIKIDTKTGTAATGALRYEELLPSDSLLYSIVNFGNSVFDESEKFKAMTIKNVLQETINEFIQIGGDAGLGRGICKLDWLEG